MWCAGTARIINYYWFNGWNCWNCWRYSRPTPRCCAFIALSVGFCRVLDFCRPSKEGHYRCYRHGTFSWDLLFLMDVRGYWTSTATMSHLCAVYPVNFLSCKVVSLRKRKSRSYSMAYSTMQCFMRWAYVTEKCKKDRKKDRQDRK